MYLQVTFTSVSYAEDLYYRIYFKIFSVLFM